MMAGVPIRTGERIGRFYVYRMVDKWGRLWEWYRQSDAPVSGGACWWLQRVGDDDGEYVYVSPVELLAGDRS